MAHMILNGRQIVRLIPQPDTNAVFQDMIMGEIGMQSCESGVLFEDDIHTLTRPIEQPAAIRLRQFDERAFIKQRIIVYTQTMQRRKALL